MAQSSTRWSPHQNPHDGEDELAGRTPTKDSDHHTPAPAATRASTPAAVPVIAPLAAFGPADSSGVKYSMDDLRRILRTVLDSRPPAPVPAPDVTAASHSEDPRERPLNARFPDIYRGKTHLEYYNFF